MKIIKYLFALIFVLGLTVACSSDDPPTKEETPTDDFNRKEMLTNWVDNIIIPSYEDFDKALETLKSDIDVFTSNPNSGSLNAVRTSWLNAYKAWQYVEMYNINKAEEIQYSYFMNIYPTRVEVIEERKDDEGNIFYVKYGIEPNIESGSYNLNDSSNYSDQGFPAIDYLLYGVGSDDTEILAKFTTDPKADNYKKYLGDLINQMISKTDIIIADWNTNRNAFIASDGNTKTSSANMFTNDFVYYFEREFRANKVGIPAGIYSSGTLPESVEGYYGKVSKELHLASYQATYNMYNGVGFNTGISGESFKTYLEHLGTKKTMTDDLLSDSINSQFTTIKSSIEGLNADYALQINTDNEKMKATFSEIQINVVNFKVEMMNAFNISIDYTDADGD